MLHTNAYPEWGMVSTSPSTSKLRRLYRAMLKVLSHVSLLERGKYNSSFTGGCWRCCLMFPSFKGANIFPPWLGQIYYFYISWQGQIYFLYSSIDVESHFVLALPVLSDVQFSLQECQCGGQNWPQVKRERSKGFVWPSDILEIRVSNFVTKWRWKAESWSEGGQHQLSLAITSWQLPH